MATSLTINESKKKERKAIRPIQTCEKFENNEKYIEEILKVASEAKTLFVKERIKEVSQALNKRQKDGLNIVDLQKELITLVDTMGQLSSASKN